MTPSRRRSWALVATVLSAPVTAGGQGAVRPFSVTDTSVRQGMFEAVAIGRDTILSTYPRAGREIRFRFSINGLENEFASGTEHTIYLRPRDGRQTTRVYVFGDDREPPPPTPESSAASEDGTAQVTIRLDLRAVQRALRDSGIYRPPLGAPVRAIEHVYAIGDPEPLTWDYGAVRPGMAQELRDPDGDGIYEATIPFATSYTRPRASDGRALWARSLDISSLPRVTSRQRIQDAVYRLSVEELRQLVREDGALSAGAKWPGVWTRDVALSTILSLAIVAPDAARASLLAKVDSLGRIIQDTGTGGSWPVSSDRMVWALAAWEVYAVTGDSAWLRRAYDITRRSAEADVHAVREARTGAYAGESSFMDWREQSYPRWMQPADIYRSENLGTNAIHFAALRTLARMARALGEPAARWDSLADGVQAAMSASLWRSDLGWFGQYRYGRTWLMTSPRSDALGEALSVIYGLATSAQRTAAIARTPVVAFGTPTFWPYIPGERLYHNATIWPFVDAYWTWAAADAGNTRAVERGLDDATRTAALFLTNKENVVAATGHFEGTALNSDRQLWSVAGTIAGTLRVLSGMRLESDRLAFRPMVPRSYGGERTVEGIRYRGATLTVIVRGFGDGVAEARVDGARVAAAEVPSTVVGAHRVELTMNGRWNEASVHEAANTFAPATPNATLRSATLAWRAIPGAARYVVYRDGVELTRTRATTMPVRARDGLDEYQVAALDAAGIASFASEPVRVVPPNAELTIEPDVATEREHAGSTGTGYVRLARDLNTAVTMSVRVDRDAEYAIDARYANGNGPVNTEDKVAVRTIIVEADTLGVLVMPQRGSGRWAEWGWTNVVRTRLRAGTHRITLTYTALDANMNGRENAALLDAVRVTRLASGAP